MPSTHDYCFMLCRETGPLTFGNSDYRERKSLCTNKQKLSAMVHIPGKTVYRCGLTCHITVQLADVRDHKLQLAIVHTAILF